MGMSTRLRATPVTGYQPILGRLVIMKSLVLVDSDDSEI